METPFGPFEPSVELNQDQERTILRSLEFLEALVTSMDGTFSVVVEQNQPSIVKSIEGNRLELPIFEAADLDAQCLAGRPPTNQIPLRIDGEAFTGDVAPGDSPRMLDAFSSIILIAANDPSLFPETLRNALG